MAIPTINYLGRIYTMHRGGAVKCTNKGTGLRIERGAFRGTSDDRSDRWYVRMTSNGEIDRRGRGYTTRERALESAAETHELMTNG